MGPRFASCSRTHWKAGHSGPARLGRATDFESDDAGATWRLPSTGLELGYLRSVAIHPKEPAFLSVNLR